MEVTESVCEGGKTWSGFWSGLIWYAVGFICIQVSYILAGIVLIAIECARVGVELSKSRITQIFFGGDTLSIAFVFLLPVMIAMLAFVVKKRRKQPLLIYLGFRDVTKSVLASWLLIAGVLLSISFVCGKVLNRPPVPEWFLTAYSSAKMVWLFWLSVTVIGPISEELLYRGYIIKVWEKSLIGPIFGTLFLSVLWAATHLQYDFYDMAWVFIFGTVLCISRLRTKSIYPAIVMHIAWNTASYFMMVYQCAA
jgi:uncharacterized protein